MQEIRLSGLKHMAGDAFAWGQGQFFDLIDDILGKPFGRYNSQGAGLGIMNHQGANARVGFLQYGLKNRFNRHLPLLFIMGALGRIGSEWSFNWGLSPKLKEGLKLKNKGY